MSEHDVPKLIHPAARTSDIVVNEWACVRLIDGSVHRGVVYAADPESGHLVLLTPAARGEDATDAMTGGDAVRPLVLFGSSIASVTQRGGSGERAAQTHLDSALLLERVDGQGHGTTLDVPTTEARRCALRYQLKMQRLPFEESTGGEFVVLGCLHCEPPYMQHSTRCENEIVLDRFLELLTHVDATGTSPPPGG